MRRARPRSLLAWSTALTLAACNALWGIDDGKLAEPDTARAGAAGAQPGGAPTDGAGAPAQAGDSGENTGGVAGGATGAAGAAGDDTSTGGVSGGGSGGATGGNGGSMSGSSGGGTGPSCSGCKLGEEQLENQSCGRCNTGTQSRKRSCDASCTWGAWSEWSLCSQCDAKPYRCCGAGKWEWCYDSDCAWTQDCAPCAASSCPEC